MDKIQANVEQIIVKKKDRKMVEFRSAALWQMRGNEKVPYLVTFRRDKVNHVLS